MTNSKISTSNISGNEIRKSEVILSVMNSVRRHVTEWHSRAYTSTTWSIGIMLGIAAYFLKPKSSNNSELALVVIGISSFLFLNQLYLWQAKKALEDNGKVIVKCEIALRLQGRGNEDFYLKEKTFFGSSREGKWVPAKDINYLRVLHGVAGILIVTTIFWI